MTSGLSRKSLVIMVAAAAILMITMGIRQSMGLFIAPIIDTTHVGYAAMSFAMAVGQLMWGAAQPTFGARRFPTSTARGNRTAIAAASAAAARSRPGNCGSRSRRHRLRPSRG